MPRGQPWPGKAQHILSSAAPVKPKVGIPDKSHRLKGPAHILDTNTSRGSNGNMRKSKLDENSCETKVNCGRTDVACVDNAGFRMVFFVLFFNIYTYLYILTIHWIEFNFTSIDFF